MDELFEVGGDWRLDVGGYNQLWIRSCVWRRSQRRSFGSGSKPTSDWLVSGYLGPTSTPSCKQVLDRFRHGFWTSHLNDLTANSDHAGGNPILVKCSMCSLIVCESPLRRPHYQLTRARILPVASLRESFG